MPIKSSSHKRRYNNVYLPIIFLITLLYAILLGSNFYSITSVIPGYLAFFFPALLIILLLVTVRYILRISLYEKRIKSLIKRKWWFKREDINSKKFLERNYINILLITLACQLIAFYIFCYNKPIDNGINFNAYAYISLLFTLLIFLIMSHLQNKRVRRKIGVLLKAKPTDEDLDQLGFSNIYEDKPEVILYSSGPRGVGYQTNMWIPVLERLNVRVGIVLRNLYIFNELDSTDIPIYYIKGIRELEQLEEVGVKTILYPANFVKNAQALRFYNLNHFFINHGESDKVVNQSKFLRAYDKLLVAGPLAEKRLDDANLALREGQVIHVGRPQVELCLNLIENKSKRIKTVLYAPTWEGFVEEANYSSVNHFGFEMFQTLAESGRYRILFKPHPFTGISKVSEVDMYKRKMYRLAKDFENVSSYGNETDIHSLMNESDIMITDISSVLNDYLYTRKPMVLMKVQNRAIDMLHKEFPSTKAAYILEDAYKIKTLIDSIEKYDELWDSRKEVCKYSLGDFKNGSMNRFKEVILDSLV